MNFFKKYHKWLGVVVAYFILTFVLSGIVLNHRKSLSFINVNRKLLPKDYHYSNWNNAGVKATLKLNNDSILIYGNIGIWLTDSSFSHFTDFNKGFPKGIDNRKICQLYFTDNKQLLAGTFYGLFNYDFSRQSWQKIHLPIHEERIVDIIQKQDTIILLSRSYLLKTTDLQHFDVLELPPPENYDNKIGMFKTLWVIHSGEIYGTIGKLIVDFAGLVFAFLTITGLYLFINRKKLEKKALSKPKKQKLQSQNRWHLKWHNKIGWITILLLLVNTITGMFLRPPMLIAIANSRVNKIPHTELATPNPWFDLLRRVLYDEQNDRFIIATMDGFYYSDDNFHSPLKRFIVQPPASVMGVTVFEKTGTNTYLIGSFEGLYKWNPETGLVFDYIKKEIYVPPTRKSRPLGEFFVTGFSQDYKGQEIFFEYNTGAHNINPYGVKFVDMPENVKKNSQISLWNVALEVHTGRIYKPLIGDFYVLIVPLVGLSLVFILVSGFIVWFKIHRKKKNINKIITTKTNIMTTKIYKVNDECVACRACVEVAGNNFEMGDSGYAYVKKQPENEEELKQTEEALEVCPVGAIERFEQSATADVEPILATSNIKKTLDKYPKLKDVLVQLSPKFKKLQTPVVYNTLAKFATFKDAAKVTGVSICEILHSLNKYLGVEKKLIERMPDCISGTTDASSNLQGEEITWSEPPERYIYNLDSMPEIIEKVANLDPQQSIVVISVEEPVELLKTVEGLNFKFNVEKNRDYRVSIFNPAPKVEFDLSWQERKHEFEELDVRTMQTDPFDIIIKKAYEIPEGKGFVLIQRFEPYPLMNMLSEMGFDYVVERLSPTEVRVYFYKVPDIEDPNAPKTEKTDVVIQSATPVAYPVIMRLLQSETIRKAVNIRELKVWEETEKHLAWVTSGKADISFSALITSAKLRNSDVKIPALFVWDNFVLLTRYKAKNFEDVKGHKIHTPLFEEAPPAKITRYLIKASGLNPDDFEFVFGNPFGRPEQIYADFVTGVADTAILREPEASYAIKIMQDRNEEISIISFNELWNEINPGFGSFPNAGIVLKGEFVRQNPKLTEIFLDELKIAIDWVNEHRQEAANLAFDIMRQPVDRIELFLERVNFKYVSGKELVEKVKAYFDILTEQGIVETKIDDDFYKIFSVENDKK